MKRVSADSYCSVILCGARAACAEVSTGSVEASKAMHGPGLHMEPSIYRRIFSGFLLLEPYRQSNVCAPTCNHYICTFRKHRGAAGLFLLVIYGSMQ
jgi:hypothetical protein